jgi:DNA-binding GntR family transcriptional regulator
MARARAGEDAEPTVTLADLAALPRSGVRTVGQLVHTVLREAIFTGVFAPGEHLRQDDLAEQIGVSRIPVRSALMQLESEGLVHFHPHRGAVVRTLTPAQVREVYELRELLEVHALRKSIEALTPDRAKELVALGKALDKAHEGGDFVEGRVSFYSALYDADNNPMLVQMIEQLRSSVGPYLLGLRVGVPTVSHASLARAAAAGDVDKAQSILLAHLEQVCGSLMSMVEDAGGEEAG